MSFSGNSSGRWSNLTKAYASFLGLSILAGLLVGVLIAPAAIAGTTVTSQGVSAFNSLPDYLKIEPPDQYTSFYAEKNGQEVKIAQFYYQNRVDVAWDQVSSYVKDAAVDTEDPHFYKEGGIDLEGIIRGAASTVSGNGVQGGSSITQQYVKNILVQRCEADYPIDGNASAKEQDKQQTALDNCYEDAAGISVGRKIQEIRYAMGVAKQYPKNTILLGYLNLVGFGGQVYGVQAAAEYYYGTSAAKLNLNESATLVAILNNPSNLRIDQTAKENITSNPSNGYKGTKDRRNYVLQRMVKQGTITQAVATATEKQPITPHIHQAPSGCQAAQSYDAGFFCAYVEQTILSSPAFGKTAADRQEFFRQGGVNVYTTLNLDLQNTAQTSMNDLIPHSDPQIDIGGAQTSMEVGTGRVVTMIENKDYSVSSDPPAGSTSVNYATPYDYGGSSGFQMGSSFKPFDLAEWLMTGHNLYQNINGSSNWFDYSNYQSTCGSTAPYGSGPFEVYNDSASENGVHSVLQGTTLSINTIYMTMAEQLNLCDVHQLASKMGVDSANPATPWFSGPSSAIGSGNGVSPLQVAQAYAAFANGGVSCTPVVIDKVTRTDTGASLPVPTTTCTQAIPTDIANAVLYALQTVMVGAGTGEAANPYDGTPIAGKTGTAGVNGNGGATQNWIATTTTKVAQVTWVGNVTGAVGLRNFEFTNAQTGQVVNGGDAKLYVANPIIAALDAHYGGTAFTAPEASLLYGGTSTAPVTGQPTGPATTAPTSTPQPSSTPQPAQTTAPTQTTPAVPPVTTPPTSNPSPTP